MNIKKYKIMYYRGEPTNYLINKNGKVLSTNYKGSGKIKRMKPKELRDGYLAVNLTINKKLHLVTIHRLVAENFLYNDDPANKTDINHKNGNKKDNRSKNLEYCTHKYNMKHAIDKGLRKYKVGNNSDLTKKEAKKIWREIIFFTKINDYRIK